MKKIKKIADVKSLKYGDQYEIAVFSDDPDKITDAQIKKANRIQEEVEKHLSKLEK